MVSKKTAGVSAIALLTAIAGGSYAISIDFSQDNDTTITDSHDTSSVGDTTNIYDNLKDEVIDKVTLAGICLQDVIPEEYTEACENR